MCRIKYHRKTKEIPGEFRLVIKWAIGTFAEKGLLNDRTTLFHLCRPSDGKHSTTDGNLILKNRCDDKDFEELHSLGDFSPGFRNIFYEPRLTHTLDNS